MVGSACSGIPFLIRFKYKPATTGRSIVYAVSFCTIEARVITSDGVIFRAEAFAKRSLFQNR